MCNLYRLKVNRAEYVDYFSAQDDWRREQEDEQGEIDKIYPGYEAPIVRNHDGARQIIGGTWGFPTREPRKRPPKEGQSPFVIRRWTNARNLKSNMWRPWLAEPVHRCLVPFATFAEPKSAADKAAGGDPNWWFSVADQSIPCFAGLWKMDAELGLVFSFLTTDPNPLVAPKHPKAMPVILQREDHDRWLTGTIDEALALQAPYPSQLMALAD